MQAHLAIGDRVASRLGSTQLYGTLGCRLRAKTLRWLVGGRGPTFCIVDNDLRVQLLTGAWACLFAEEMRYVIPNRGIAVPMLARRRRVSSAARPTRGGRLDHQARYQASSCEIGRRKVHTSSTVEI